MAPSIATLIDHSLLHPTLDDRALEEGCQLAARYGVASVCVKPYAVSAAAGLLAESTVRVGTVIGFPHGANASAIKAAEAEQACADGAVELDMVVNVGKALSRDWDYVAADVWAVVDVAHARGAIVKVIFENDFLARDNDKVRLCEICRDVDADYVKTSTGFGFVKDASGHYGYRGATLDDVRLMLAHCGPRMQVKAAGGIRTYAHAAQMRELGVARIGATATAEIIAGEQEAMGAADA